MTSVVSNVLIENLSLVYSSQSFSDFSNKKKEKEKRESEKKLEFKRGRGETLLVVEDNENILSLLSELFTLSGYTVIKAKGVVEALNQFRENSKIKLILSDILLPDGNGVDLVERLLRKNPDLKAILTTGYIKDSHLLKIKKRGFAFLQKPFDLCCLLKIVRELLDI